MTYTNDGISCGSDMYMYEAMVREGNDARMLSFAPSTGVDGGHSNPQNAWAWVAGCLGLSEASVQHVNNHSVHVLEVMSLHHRLLHVKQI